MTYAPDTRYELYTYTEDPNQRERRRMIRAFEDFEQARQATIARLNAYRRHGFIITWTGQVYDRQNRYVLSVGMERVN